MSDPGRTAFAGVVLVLLGGLSVLAACGDDGTSRGWTYYGGDEGFTRYAPLDQIEAENVSDLRIAWRRDGADTSYARGIPRLPIPNYLNSTPIFVNGILYAPNALGFVEAFEPATGETIWLQEPAKRTVEEVAGQSSRGLDYWTDGTDERILAVRGEHLYALDPATGEPAAGFGQDGRVHLTPPNARRFQWRAGPLAVGDVVVVGGTLDGAGDSGDEWRGTPPEDIRGFDVRTGEHLWTFHVVPREGEFGTQTWEDGSWRASGDLGSWCCLSGDEELGHVYVPTSAPTAAYYGGHRPGDNLFSNSLLALDAETGERVWHFQMVRHDVWEYDNVGPPILGEITVDGERIRVVAQANKNGFLYVFDRETGDPVWPIEERSVPGSRVPGERLAPTQPIPSRPPGFDRHGIGPEDLLSLTPELERRARAIADSFVTGGDYMPPSLVRPGVEGTKGTLLVPGSWGAGNWNTGAFDPETGFYYAVSHTIPRVYRITPVEDDGTEMDYYSPNREAPYIDGLPIVDPPWGRITAFDLDTGTEAWMVPNGEGPRDHPLLTGSDVGYLGIASRPVPLVTRTLLFLGEGSDLHGGIPEGMWGTTFRAYDKATGAIVHEMELPSATTGGPMSFMHEGKQYIVVAVGAREHEAEWIALSLP